MSDPIYVVNGCDNCPFAVKFGLQGALLCNITADRKPDHLYRPHTCPLNKGTITVRYEEPLPF